MVTGKMAEGVGNAPTSAMPILFSRQVQPAYICLPSVRVESGEMSDERLSISTKLVNAAGLAPAVTRSQAEHVAATLRVVGPGRLERAAGGLVLVEAERLIPWNDAPLEDGIKPGRTYPTSD